VFLGGAGAYEKAVDRIRELRERIDQIESGEDA
jgi:hypothetical protein